MGTLEEHLIKKINEARSEIASLNTKILTFSIILDWHTKFSLIFVQAQGATNRLVNQNIARHYQGHDRTDSSDVLDEVRQKIICQIDGTLMALNQKMPFSDTPIPQEVITKVRDIKLTTLLREFNNGLKSAPNLCMIGYRTILSLVLKERAKLEKPESKLATKDDVAFAPDIELAISEKIVSESEMKILRAYQASDRNNFDNIAHKAGKKNLVEEESIGAAIKNLNTLLRTII